MLDMQGTNAMTLGDSPRKYMYDIYVASHQAVSVHLLRPKTHLGMQGSHRLEKYLNLEGFLEKSLKIKSALKSTGKSLKSLEKSLNSTIFCRTKHCR